MNKFNLHMHIKEVHFTNHSTQRWNERVGPYASRTFLNELVMKLLRLKRIRFEKSYGIIDEDILFGFEIVGENEDILLVKTAFGRISIKPQIANLQAIAQRRFSLKVESWLIACQQLPVVTLEEEEKVRQINERIDEKVRKFNKRLQKAVTIYEPTYNPFDYDVIAHEQLLDELIGMI